MSPFVVNGIFWRGEFLASLPMSAAADGRALHTFFFLLKTFTRYLIKLFPNVFKNFQWTVK
jgi:hypothetical protein